MGKHIWKKEKEPELCFCFFLFAGQRRREKEEGIKPLQTPCLPRFSCGGAWVSGGGVWRRRAATVPAVAEGLSCNSRLFWRLFL
jgi:hypothetical protein